MSVSLSPADWELLLYRIKSGKCTPFLGAGACYGHLPMAHQIASRWARRYEYPLEGEDDLARVAQFIAVESQDASLPKELLVDEFLAAHPPDFTRPDEPHGLLASLPLPLYLTTNYDPFMLKALHAAGRESARQELCAWNVRRPVRKKERSGAPILSATVEQPVVFHLHGHIGQHDSMILTEDDYLDFLVRLIRYDELLPNYVQEAMAGTSLLFIGYRLADWNFRVLFRILAGFLERSLAKAHISVQLPPGSTPEQQERAMKYLSAHFSGQKIRVFWGTASEFSTELRRRWEGFHGGT